MSCCARPGCKAPATHAPRLRMWPASCHPARRTPAREILHVIGIGLCADHAAAFDPAPYLTAAWGDSGLTLRGAIARQAIAAGKGAPDWSTVTVEALGVTALPWAAAWLTGPGEKR